MLFEFVEDIGSVLVYGFGGYFDVVLYKDVYFGIELFIVIFDMFSWFVIFFFFWRFIYVFVGLVLEFYFWCCVGFSKVWYEWFVILLDVLFVYNFNGCLYWVGL